MEKIRYKKANYGGLVGRGRWLIQSFRKKGTYTRQEVDDLLRYLEEMVMRSEKILDIMSVQIVEILAPEVIGTLGREEPRVHNRKTRVYSEQPKPITHKG